MSQKIRPKPNRAATVIYGDVQEAEEVTDVVGIKIQMSEEKCKEIFERSKEEIKDLITECSPEDQKPISD